MDPRCRLRRGVNYIAAQLRLQQKKEKMKLKHSHDLEVLIENVARRTALEMRPLIDLDKMIADVNKIAHTALEGMQTLEKKLQEKIEEIRTTTLTAVYDVANGIEANVQNEYGSLKCLEARLLDEIAFVERQAGTTDANTITHKDAVSNALARLTGGRVSIKFEDDDGNDIDSDTDDEGEG